MTANLRLRLLVLLVVPLTLLALMGGWFGYRSADEASTQHDQRLLRLLPALADSVLAPSIAEGTPPLVALTPAIEDVLRQRGDDVGYAIGDCRAMSLPATPGSASTCLPRRWPNSTVRSMTA